MDVARLKTRGSKVIVTGRIDLKYVFLARKSSFRWSIDQPPVVPSSLALSAPAGGGGGGHGGTCSSGGSEAVLAPSVCLLSQLRPALLPLLAVSAPSQQSRRLPAARLIARGGLFSRRRLERRSPPVQIWLSPVLPDAAPPPPLSQRLLFSSSGSNRQPTWASCEANVCDPDRSALPRPPSGERANT